MFRFRPHLPRVDNVPFKDEVWPKFLWGNAARVLGIG
jgi:predicted TIM-barrel fold metal-dependent hydrolase